MFTKINRTRDGRLECREYIGCGGTFWLGTWPRAIPKLAVSGQPLVAIERNAAADLLKGVRRAFVQLKYKRAQ